MRWFLVVWDVFGLVVMVLVVWMFFGLLGYIKCGWEGYIWVGMVLVESGGVWLCSSRFG